VAGAEEVPQPRPPARPKHTAFVRGLSTKIRHETVSFAIGLPECARMYSIPVGDEDFCAAAWARHVLARAEGAPLSQCLSASRAGATSIKFQRASHALNMDVKGVASNAQFAWATVAPYHGSYT